MYSKVEFFCHGSIMWREPTSDSQYIIRRKEIQKEIRQIISKAGLEGVTVETEVYCLQTWHGKAFLRSEDLPPEQQPLPMACRKSIASPWLEKIQRLQMPPYLSSYISIYVNEGGYSINGLILVWSNRFGWEESKLVSPSVQGWITRLVNMWSTRVD